MCPYLDNTFIVVAADTVAAIALFFLPGDLRFTRCLNWFIVQHALYVDDRARTIRAQIIGSDIDSCLFYIRMDVHRAAGKIG
jgi:hypothetical protein